MKEASKMTMPILDSKDLDIIINDDANSNNHAYRILQHLIKKGKVSIGEVRVVASATSMGKGTMVNAEVVNNEHACATDPGITKDINANNDVTTINDTTKITNTTTSVTSVVKPSQQKTQHQQSLNLSSRYLKRHVALQIQYDGTLYTGLAQDTSVSSSGKGKDGSVEAILFEALIRSRLIDDPSTGCLSANKKQPSRKEMYNYNRCGRTDKGVSAHGQVVSLNLYSAFPKDAMLDKEDDENKKIHMTEQDLPKNSLTPLKCYSPPNPNKVSSKQRKALTKQRKKQYMKDKSEKKESERLRHLSPLELKQWKDKEQLQQKKKNPQKQSESQPKQQEMKEASSLPPTTTQTKSILTERIMTEHDYTRILNGLLPSSIRILGWCPVSTKFNARFSTTNRTYRYFFVRRNMNLTRMRDGLKRLLPPPQCSDGSDEGKKRKQHDFRNLCRVNVEEVDNFERIIEDARIVVMNDDDNDKHYKNNIHDNINHNRQTCYIEIIGRAFLWRQVRCITSILFLLGKGSELPSVMNELLDVTKNPGKPSYEPAASYPLVLYNCGYYVHKHDPKFNSRCGSSTSDGGDDNNENIDYDTDNNRLLFASTVRETWRTSVLYESLWEDSMIKAAKYKDILNKMGKDVLVNGHDLNTFVQESIMGKNKKLTKIESRSRRDGKTKKKELNITTGTDMVVTPTSATPATTSMMKNKTFEVDDEEDKSERDETTSNNNISNEAVLTWSEALEYIHAKLKLKPGDNIATTPSAAAVDGSQSSLNKTKKSKQKNGGEGNKEEYTRCYGGEGNSHHRAASTTHVHVPLMERFRGSTYEEKVASLLTVRSNNNNFGGTPTATSANNNGNGGNNGNSTIGVKRRKERYEINEAKRRKKKCNSNDQVVIVKAGVIIKKEREEADDGVYDDGNIGNDDEGTFFHEMLMQGGSGI